MNPIDQLEFWIGGLSLHNEETGDCCPDFSCCNPKLHAPKHERINFTRFWKEGNIAPCEIMLMNFLERSLAVTNPDLNITVLSDIREWNA